MCQKTTNVNVDTDSTYNDQQKLPPPTTLLSKSTTSAVNKRNIDYMCFDDNKCQKTNNDILDKHSLHQVNNNTDSFLWNDQNENKNNYDSNSNSNDEKSFQFLNINNMTAINEKLKGFVTSDITNDDDDW